MPFSPHWTIGGVFLIGIGTFLIGIILMFTWRAVSPPFFRGETLTHATPTLVVDSDDLPPSIAVAGGP